MITSNTIRKKSIIIFLFSFNRGGAEWVVTNLANTMTKNGIRVTVWSVKPGEMFAELSNNIIVKSYDGNYIKAYIKLFFGLMRNDYYVMLTTQRTASVFAFFAKTLSFSKTKHVVREAASNFSATISRQKKFLQPIWQTLFRLSYQQSNHIIVNSMGTLDDLVRSGIINSKQEHITQIDNPINVKEIQLRAKKNLPLTFSKTDKSFKVVSIGRLVPKKNMDILLMAFGEFIKQKTNAQLIIVGEGPQKQNLVTLANKLKVSNNVFFTGQLENPYPVLQQADLFVLASSWEGFGQVIIEALALGVPVVATNIQCGPAHILQNGKYGLLVEPNNTTELLNGMLKSVKTKHDIPALVNRAKDFDSEKISNVYQSVLFS